MNWILRNGGGLRVVAALTLMFLGALSPEGRSRAAELSLDFSKYPIGAPPAEFRATLSGGGPPPEWRVLQVDAPAPIATSTSTTGAPLRYAETVLAQTSTDPTDERFPLLVYQPEVFADFTATLRFRTMAGKVERMAGLAFRLQDERNYYVIRASSLGNNLRFYKFVDGVRTDPLGPEIKIPSGEWHTLEITCKGNAIYSRLDGQEGIPMITDPSFAKGRLALWTKSDSVSHFGRLDVRYDLVKTLPQRLVDRVREKYPRLLGVAIYAKDGDQVKALAASDAATVGKPGADAEVQALADGKVFAGLAKEGSEAVFPLRDRNGDPIFAVRFRMRSFPGQTDANAAARGRPMADDLEQVVRAADREELR